MVIKFTNSGYVSLTIDAVTNADIADIKSTSIGEVDKEPISNNSHDTNHHNLDKSNTTTKPSHD